jgi:hypothetical protein
MPKYKIGYRLHADRRIYEMGLEALGLWTIALSWSSCYGTDGRIPEDIATDLGPRRLWNRLQEFGFVHLRRDQPTDHEDDEDWLYQLDPSDGCGWMLPRRWQR